MLFKSPPPSHSNGAVPRVFTHKDARLLVERMRDPAFLPGGKSGLKKTAIHDLLEARILRSYSMLAPSARASLEPGDISLLRDSLLDCALFDIPSSPVLPGSAFFVTVAVPLLSILAFCEPIISAFHVRAERLSAGTQSLGSVLSFWLENLDSAVWLFSSFGLLADQAFSSLRSRIFLSRLAKNMDQALADAIRSPARIPHEEIPVPSDA